MKFGIPNCDVNRHYMLRTFYIHSRFLPEDENSPNT